MGNFFKEMVTNFTPVWAVDPIMDEANVSESNFFRTGGSPADEWYQNREAKIKESKVESGRIAAEESRLAPVRAANPNALILSDQGSPSANYAQVTNALWSDYQNNFAKYQYELLNNMTSENPALVGQEVAAAQGLAGRSFDTAAKNRAVTMARYGMAPDQQVSASLARQSDLARGAGMAGAANATRARLKERDMELMTSGVPNVAGRSYGLSTGGV